MSNLKRWLSTLPLLAITAFPAMAGSSDAKPANETTANATSPEAVPVAASPNLVPAASDVNVTALLGV